MQEIYYLHNQNYKNLVEGTIYCPWFIIRKY